MVTNRPSIVTAPNNGHSRPDNKHSRPNNSHRGHNNGHHYPKTVTAPRYGAEPNNGFGASIMVMALWEKSPMAHLW